MSYDRLWSIIGGLIVAIIALWLVLLGWAFACALVSNDLTDPGSVGAIGILVQVAIIAGCAVAAGVCAFLAHRDDPMRAKGVTR